MSGIYIHIPFCRQACHYCNFHFSTSLRKKDALAEAICKEIELVKEHEEFISEKIETVYFGGGTPSILESIDVEKILKAIQYNFDIASTAEITLEANPDDIGNEKLSAWKSMGINRLSVGIQSFFEEDLIWMNRAHNSEQAINSLQLVVKYFDNITIDLIYGVPGLTHERWKKNVEMAINLKIPHLSCYALTVEPKTPLDKLIFKNKKQNVIPEQQAEQFLLLMHWLKTAGYEHYEISNFAKQGYRSRHNSSYWQGKNYLGIGPAAHSYDGNSRRWNVANNQQYIDAIENNTIPFEKEILTSTQKINEYIMIALRTMDGIDLKKLDKIYKNKVLNDAEKYIQQKLLVLNKNYLQLTDQGKLFADGIAAALFL